MKGTSCVISWKKTLNYDKKVPVLLAQKLEPGISENNRICDRNCNKLNAMFNPLLECFSENGKCSFKLEAFFLQSLFHN